MSILIHSLLEALASIRRQQRRLLPMALGIVWGMASVMVLLAVASGFEESQRRVLGAFGDRFLLLRLNRAELDRAAGGEDRRLMMDPYDIERLRAGAPAIRHLSPLNMAYRARITGRSGAGSRVRLAGALPEIRRLRNLPLAEGRFYDEIDEEERNRVMVLGLRARQQLFGNGPAVGQKVRVAGFSTAAVPDRPTPREPSVAGRLGPSPPSRSPQPSLDQPDPDDVGIGGELFEVIGVLDDVEIRSESYVSVARMGFIPFSTSTAVFDREYNTIYIEPRTLEDRDLALRQFRQVMGSRYGFEEDDLNAVLIYFDAIGRARSIAMVFRGVRLFLSVVGVLILAIGTLGVVNVILVSLSSRHYEIGLRKALGATPFHISVQFFAEAVIACLASGLAGFAVGFLIIRSLAFVPMPEGFSRPVLDATAALNSFALLLGVAVAAGVYPARRAAAQSPVQALRERG